jgi:Ca2+-binding EF-hand superfamily protein/endonuclease/exonuclease/phosphatase family metal-dependent hydrolase
MAKIDKHGKGAPKHPHRAASAGKAAEARDKDKDKDRDDKAKAKPQAGSWQYGFDKADKNHDGKVKKSELKLAKLDKKAYDADGDGQVTKREFHAGHRRANSFAGLDRDRDGALDKSEMGKASRFTKASYDTDGDGRVTETEFVASRRVENVARKEARRDAAFEALTGQDKKALKRYDANKDGAISRTEFGAGKDQDRAIAREKKIAANFEKAGGRNGVLKAGEGSLYKAYDQDADGKVTQAEFKVGQQADRAAYWASGVTAGKPGKLITRRLDLDKLGLGLNRLDDAPGRPGAPSPADPGSPSAKGDTDVVISSFNILGNSHTTANGNKPGYASGTERMKGAVQLLKQHGVDIVGFQEMEGIQKKTFQRMAGDDYAIYSGSKGGKPDPANSIAWRKDKWELVKGDSVAIPYFHGNIRKMPVVLLRNKQTGQETYVANFHNPASTKRVGDQERFREQAERIQVALANRLRKTGRPVIITGDMNERHDYHQAMTKGSPGMHASDSKNGRISKNPGIDWIFGSPDVSFTRYVRDRGALVKRTTDHPMIISRARIKAGNR